jgi:hypothetical protein
MAAVGRKCCAPRAHPAQRARYRWRAMRAQVARASRPWLFATRRGPDARGTNCSLTKRTTGGSALPSIARAPKCAQMCLNVPSKLNMQNEPTEAEGERGNMRALAHLLPNAPICAINLEYAKRTHRSTTARNFWRRRSLSGRACVARGWQMQSARLPRGGDAGVAATEETER